MWNIDNKLQSPLIRNSTHFQHTQKIDQLAIGRLIGWLAIEQNLVRFSNLVGWSIQFGTKIRLQLVHTIRSIDRLSNRIYQLDRFSNW